MDVRRIYDRLTDAGHAVYVTGDGRLAVACASTLTDDDRHVIRAHRADLVAWLLPSPSFGPKAVEDGGILAELIDNDPKASLECIKERSAELGINGIRWPFALCALPERFNMPRN